MGWHALGHIAAEANAAFTPDILNRQIVHLTDVQGYLREELSAAYALLSIETMRHLWEAEATGEKRLFHAVRRNDARELTFLREQFLQQIDPQAEHSNTAILAWAVFVESILLNERLIEDIQKTVPAGTCGLTAQSWLPFFGPNPSQEARDIYEQYVRIRWPLRIFTVDPAITEQNVASLSTTYRQMQLSVALAVAGGNMSGSAALRTLRDIKRDMATIDLNRTVVGFSHGEDTFGWRFYPRFQTARLKATLKFSSAI